MQCFFLKRREQCTAVASDLCQLLRRKLRLYVVLWRVRFLRQEFDPTVKEAAAWAIGYIAQHTAGGCVHGQAHKRGNDARQRRNRTSEGCFGPLCTRHSLSTRVDQLTPKFFNDCMHVHTLHTQRPHTSHLTGHSHTRCLSLSPPDGFRAHAPSDLAQNVLDVGTVPLLVLCIQEPEITLKRISASAMSDVCKHTPELAQAVVDAGAVAYLSPLIMHPDSKLKRQARNCWCTLGTHTWPFHCPTIT